MPRLLVLLALVASALPAAAQHDPEEEPLPFELFQDRPGDGPSARYARLLAAAPEYAAGTQAGDFVRQVLAQEAGALGDPEAALRWADATLSATRWDSVGTLPDGTRAVDAVAEIVRRAEDARFVMVNEAHHDASTRLLTLALLEPLYARGYRYFAAETFFPDSVLAELPGYPTVGMGTYTDEPVFGAVVREALRLGYTLVPYEVEEDDRVEGDSLSYQQRRDLSEARHLADRTLGRDPDARVLVHAGYGHVNEAPTAWFSPMADYFRQRTGLDPLTVEQTELGPASEPAFEHPRYRAALGAGLVTDRPVVLLAADGAPLAPVGAEWTVDLQVLRPRLDGAPAEALGHGTIRPFELAEGCTPCVVEVRRLDEGPDAVPVDRRVVSEAVRLVGPRDVPLVVTVVEGETGALLDHRIVTAR